MQYQCRLASSTGEIVEGIYVADSEARLRHELEEKGLFILSLKPKGAIAGLPFPFLTPFQLSDFPPQRFQAVAGNRHLRSYFSHILCKG